MEDARTFFLIIVPISIIFIFIMTRKPGQPPPESDDLSPDQEE